MKCMFKSLVALFLALLVACSVGMAEEVDFDFLKPYLTQDEAITLAQNVDSMIRYTVDEEENILFEGENTHEVKPYENGYRISDVFEAVKTVFERYECRYSLEGIRGIMYRMGCNVELRMNEDNSFILGTINNGEYSLVVPVSGLSSDGSCYMAYDFDVYDAISWMLAVEDMNDTFYDKMQSQMAPSLDEYLNEFEVVWLARTIQDDLKIWFENGKITFVADVEASISKYEDGYRLDEVFNAVDDAVTGNTFYAKRGIRNILHSLGYNDATIEVVSDNDGNEAFVIHIADNQDFSVKVISNDDGILFCRAMEFYDRLFEAIVGEDFIYESEE